MNLQEELKALKKRIAELEEQVKEEQEFPQDGDKYWYMDEEGAVFCIFYKNHYLDGYHQEIGNIFRTKEQAEFVVEKLKVEAELRKFSKPFELGSLNFIICFDIEQDEIYSETRRFMIQGAIYFESIEKAQQAVSTVGVERVKKYIFGVED